MSWTVLAALVAILGTAFLLVLMRRSELARIRRSLTRREQVVRQGGDKVQLLHPIVDLSRCLGCATCTAVCPEEGVLEIVHGQAVVVNGARCMGIAACERECPVGAIQITVNNLAQREDVPAVTADLEAVGTPGLFLAGEVTAHALIKSAVEQGTAVGAEVARRIDGGTAKQSGVLDLCIVGAGPAGLACSLEAKRRGLRFLTLDQEARIGGSVAKYPRRKLVVTEPVDLPLHGRLARSAYTKEELVALWEGLAKEHELPIEGGQVFESLERDEAGHFIVRTETAAFPAAHVCLALGRRGVAKKLDVPGEERTKVSFSLLDAQSYQGRRVLVVGGGDSAVEAALALAEQPGNEVTLSYRKESFFRVGSRSEQRVQEARAQDKLHVLFQSSVQEIGEETVELTVDGEDTPRFLPNDDVFVMAGGTAPTELLGRAGISFDASAHEPADPVGEQGTGLVNAIGIAFFFSLAALVWALWHVDYYQLASHVRPTHDKHVLLRPARGIGLGLGIAATVMVAVNLLYLVRRSPRFRFRLGSLQHWMTSHLATGILALLCALLHGAMAPGETPGGHAFWALAVLLVTGAIGRYFYAYVPRAANGRELELNEAKAELRRLADEWNRGDERFREITALVDDRQWNGSFLGRVVALFGLQLAWHRLLRRLTQQGRAEGLPDEQIRETIRVSRVAYRTALKAAHFEDLRAILSTWRYLHRWVAILMVLLLVVHVAHALIYGFVGGAAG
ncbi:MAG: NAD(P)-binding domain-containing protein [Planctomycetota bacterium]|jgi:thioredoxin reductase